jgi:uncharacterized protein (UPF0264 family)
MESVFGLAAPPQKHFSAVPSLMFRLLVSVRNLEEAEMARRAGVDLVDLKEPAAGALGPVAPGERSRIAKHWGQLGPTELIPPLSAALGELPEFANGEPLSGPTRPFGPGDCFRYAKIGLAGAARNATWRERWQAIAASLPHPTAMVAAAYADAPAAQSPEPEDVLELALANRAEVFLIDTFDKRAGSLFELLPANRLDRLREQARGRLEFALAGSVQRRHESRLRELQPEIVAIRGAVCRSGRAGALCPQLLCEWRMLTRNWQRN